MAVNREERPAPPAGVELLRVPEAVEFAQEQAAQRGDRRALLMAPDIRRDIETGRLQLGIDAFWQAVPGHPKGGYWVITRAAIERRIRERLRGPGRPKKAADSAPAVGLVSVPAPTGVQGEVAPLVEVSPVPSTMADTPAVQAGPVQPMAPPAVTPTKSKPQPTQPQAEAESAGWIVAIANWRVRGLEAFSVVDPERYRAAVRASLSGLPKDRLGSVHVCRCGWAGQREAMRWEPHPDGKGRYPVCPDCGRRVESTEVAYVLTAARQLRSERNFIENNLRLTRNDRWRTEMRRHLRDLELLARQAALEESVTPGVSAQVAALVGQVQQALATAVIVPPVMRQEPAYGAAEARVRPQVNKAMANLDVFRLQDPPAKELLPLVRQEGASALARALLAGALPWSAVWSTVRWLHAQGVGGQEIAAMASRLEQLANLPEHDRSEVLQICREVRRRMRGAGDSFWSTGQELVRESHLYPGNINRVRWERHRDAAETAHGLLEMMRSLLENEAMAQLRVEIAAQVERLAGDAEAEAQRTGKPALQIVAGWVRGKNKRLGDASLLALVAYPLALRVNGGQVPGMDAQ